MNLNDQHAGPISNARIRELVAEGYSDTEMARELQCSASAIQRRRSKMGLAPTNPKHRAQHRGPLEVIEHNADPVLARPWI